MKKLLAAGVVAASTLLACADGAGRLPFFASGEAATPIADPAEAEAVVAALFDGMRAGDSTAVRALFMPGATLTSSFERDGIPVSQGGGHRRIRPRGGHSPR